MGQDTSCGICGKHYQDCSHYLKEHIPRKGKALCGAKKVILLNDDWEECDIDHDDICKKCLKLRGPTRLTDDELAEVAAFWDNAERVPDDWIDAPEAIPHGGFKKPKETK